MTRDEARPAGGQTAGDGEDAVEQPRLVRPLARLLLAIFFRTIEVVGAEKVPRRGPLVFAANHINGLVDPALLLIALPRQPRFLAKSTLWKMAVVRPFLELAAAIPVYRRSDPGVDASQNEDTFARCHAALAAGGAIALFPEGRSHNEPALVPLKTGISRIVLEAEERYGGIGTRIVPIGLTFEDKGRFRSRVLVQIGEPVDPTPELADYQQAPREAVRTLTERVRQSLKTVTLNFPSWQEARLIERAAELYARPQSELPSETPLASRFAVLKAFIAGYLSLRERAPERVAAVASAVASYDELLARHRLRDAQVAARYPAGGVVRFVAKSLLLLLVRMPLAVLGTVLNGLPFWAVHTVAPRMGKTPDVLATYKLFGSLIFYPLAWIVAASLAGGWLGWPAGVAAFLLAPLTGVIALRFWERRSFFLSEARAYLMLRAARHGAPGAGAEDEADDGGEPASLRVLDQRRRSVLDAVRGLVAEIEEPDAGLPDGVSAPASGDRS